MLAPHLARGAKAGVVAGLGFGAFVATVTNPLVAFAEANAHADGGEPGHHAGAASEGILAAATTDLVSVAGGVLWGVLLGTVAFGAAYYLLEPALPGVGATRSYALGAAGFLTVSGAPWLVLPPSPPGVEPTLSTTTGLAVYGAMLLAGALVCTGSVLAYRRARRAPSDRGRLAGALAGSLPLAALVAIGIAAPATTAGGPLPDALAAGFTAVVAFGQALLWVVLAATHAHLQTRADGASAGDDDDRTTDATDTAGPVVAD
jgi:hypothetical protein